MQLAAIAIQSYTLREECLLKLPGGVFENKKLPMEQSDWLEFTSHGTSTNIH